MQQQGFTIFLLIMGGIILIAMTLPGVMGILTQEATFYHRGRATTYRGQKAVVVGLSSVIGSVWFFLLLYFLVTRSSMTGPATICLVGMIVTFVVLGVVGMFVPGETIRRR